MLRYMRPKAGLLIVAALLGGSVGVGTAGGGEIVPNASSTFTNNMAGAQESPPADDGTGTAKITLSPGSGKVCFTVRFEATGTPNRGHIHVGAAGANGGISVALFELVGLPADARNDALENGKLSGCTTADPALVQTMIANPTGYYVNLHNARYAAGSMRCQLVDP